VSWSQKEVLDFCRKIPAHVRSNRVISKTTDGSKLSITIFFFSAGTIRMPSLDVRFGRVILRMSAASETMGKFERRK